MKKIKPLLLILTLFISVPFFGQSYISIPDNGGLWKETYWWQPSPFFYNGIGDTYIIGDTVFNDTIYQKVYNLRRDVFCSDIMISGPNYSGGIRQDSISQKAYYKLNGSESEKLLYDFSLNIGDTLPGDMNWISYPGVYIKKIDTILTHDGIPRRRWHLDHEHPYEGWPQIIEGIGSTSGLLGGIEPYWEGWNELLCFKINGVDVWRSFRDTCFVITDSCAIVGIQNNINYGNKIYPNPASSKIYLSNPKCSIILHTLQGKLVLSSSPGERMISLEGIAPGVYIATILDEVKAIGREKLVVR